MTKYKLFIVALSLMYFLSSCKKDSTDGSTSPIIPPSDTTKGTVKAFILLTPINPSIWPVTVELLRSRFPAFDTVQVLQTDNNGACTFSNVPAGNYQLIALPNQYFGGTTYSEQFTISSLTPIDTIRLLHRPFHFLFPDTVEVYKDFTFLIDTTVNFSIWNIGSRDTLLCNFDTSFIPKWCNVKIKTSVFPPQLVPPFSNIVIAYKVEAYTNHLLPSVMKVPFKDQFEQDTLYINILPM